MTGLDKVMMLYKQAGFKVTTIYSDKEFKPLEDIIFQEYHSTLNCSCAQEHVPKAKNNNNVIKERTRAAYHSLPFKAITKTMTKYLVMDATKKLNFFPPRGGISKYYSPCMILHQKPLDYNRDCHFSIFTYGIAHDEPDPSNTQQARGIDALYLRVEKSIQGSHEVLNLATGEVIS